MGAALLSLSAFADKTVYFEIPSGLSSVAVNNIYVYAENRENNVNTSYSGDWPGQAITTLDKVEIAFNDETKTCYKFTTNDAVNTVQIHNQATYCWLNDGIIDHTAYDASGNRFGLVLSTADNGLKAYGAAALVVGQYNDWAFTEAALMTYNGTTTPTEWTTTINDFSGEFQIVYYADKNLTWYGNNTAVNMGVDWNLYSGNPNLTISGLTAGTNLNFCFKLSDTRQLYVHKASQVVAKPEQGTEFAASGNYTLLASASYLNGIGSDIAKENITISATPDFDTDQFVNVDDPSQKCWKAPSVSSAKADANGIVLTFDVPYAGNYKDFTIKIADLNGQGEQTVNLGDVKFFPTVESLGLGINGVQLVAEGNTLSVPEGQKIKPWAESGLGSLEHARLTLAEGISSVGLVVKYKLAESTQAADAEGWSTYGSNGIDVSKGQNYVFSLEQNGVTNATNYQTAINDQNIETGVEAIELGEGEATYYNLQGVRVANPENGIFVKVVNGNAVKVVL